MTIRSAQALPCLLLLATGCFTPNTMATDPQGEGETDPSSSTVGGTDAETTSTTSSGVETLEPTTDTSSATGTTGDPATTDDPATTTEDTGETSDGSSETSSGLTRPNIDEFTVNGSSDPVEVGAASHLVVRAEVSDADGIVTDVEVSFDGEVLASGTPEAGVFEFTWTVSGEEMNESSSLEVRATDDDDLSSTASLSAVLDMPNGGLIEAWNFDNGESSSVYSIKPTANGEVVWAGQTFVGGDTIMRVDRAEGPVWQNTSSTDRDFAADVLPLDDGTFVVATALGTGFDLSSELRRYSSSGAPSGSSSFDGSPNSSSNWPQGVARDNSGDYYVLGSYIGETAFSSYLAKTDPSLNQVWIRDVSGSIATDGEPFVYDFDVRADGMIAVIGARVVGTDKLWLGLYDQAGSLSDQISLTSEFESSVGYGVAWTSGGLTVSGATDDGNGWSRFVRAYDSDLLEEWTLSGPANTDFALAVDADPFGRVVVVSAETCELNLDIVRFDGCRLVLRSYDNDDGTLRWQHVAESSDDEFVGLTLPRPGFKADVTTDELGYVYVSAEHELPIGENEARSEWWAERHHP